jgi:hypothetical protein
MSIYDDIEALGLLGEDYVAPIADHDQIAAMAEFSLRDFLAAIGDSGLQPFMRSIGWAVVNAVHREIEKLERRTDDNAAVIRDLVQTQDGSEVRDVELQDAMLLQDRMAECRDALATFREAAAETFAVATGEPWLPRSGNRTGHGVTAAQIDARAMLKAARDKRAADLTPEGPRYIVAGHKGWTDVDTVFAKLDELRARKPDLVIVTKDGPGVELVARRWAALRGAAHIATRMNWGLGKRAAFDSIQQQLALKPAGIVTFEDAARPLNGLCLNLIQNAEQRRIKVWRIGQPRSGAHAA